MENEKAKKKRSENFSKEEKALMVRLVADNKSVIENKRTDGMTIKEKERAWEKLTDMFNSRDFVRKRSTKQLKSFYDNFKRRSKQKKVQDKINIYKTGGGVCETPLLDETSSQLLSIISDQTESIPNEFDGDALYIDGTEYTYIDTRVEENSVTHNPPVILEKAALEVRIATPDDSVTPASSLTLTKYYSRNQDQLLL